MNAQELLQGISDYCRHSGLAESTFGRRAVNDGKLARRLCNGGRITTDTLDRIRSFMAQNVGRSPMRPAIITRPQHVSATPFAVTGPAAVAGTTPMAFAPNGGAAS